MTNNNNEIVKITNKLMPAMKIDEVVYAFDEYQKLRKKLERSGDFIEFSTTAGKKKAPTKQWRVKLERFFGLSIEITKEWESKEENNSITYHKRARAIHPKSDLFHEATGACNTNEKIRTIDQIVYQIKNKHKNWSDDFITKMAKTALRDEVAKAPHNAESHAETRAKNRAILEFVGFGEVSAEEMSGSREDYTSKDNNPDNNLATDPQKDEIYGTVICEKCGIRVYGYRCPKCKNTDLHIVNKGFYHSHLMTKDDFKKEMKPTMQPEKLTKAEAIKIWDWWRGNKEKSIIGQRTKREEKENKSKLAKKDTKDEIADEDIPF